MSRLPRFTILVILITAAYLRLAQSASNPGWFSDEGTHLDIARHLTEGRAQYLALRGSTLLAARLPLFDWLLAGLITAAGTIADPARGIAVLRAFTGSLGVLTTLLLYVVPARLGGPRGRALGLLAALAYALYPQAVIYSRFGFSYNLVAPLLLITLWALAEYQRATARRGPLVLRWLALASLAVGLAVLTDLWAWVLFVPLLVVTLLGARRVGRMALVALVPAVLPLSLYVMTMLVRAPAAFIFDLAFTFARVSGLSPLAQAELLASNLVTLFAQEGWVALGAIGLFRLRPARLRRLALLFFWLPLLLIGRTVPLVSLSFYYLIPLLPLTALGLGALAHEGAYALARLVGRGLRRGLGPAAARWGFAAAALAVAGVAVYLAATTATQTRTGFTTAIDPFLLNPADARAAAQFVNAQTAPGDVVIASPGLAWLIRANAADFQMTLAYSGTPTPHFPAHLPASRWAFDPSLSQARFVIVDNLWRNWGVFNLPGLAALLTEVEQWPRAFQAGEIAVYERDE